MRRLVLFLLLFLCTSVHQGFAQTDYSFLKGLIPYATNADRQEYQKLAAKSRPDYYSPEGKKLTENEKLFYIKNKYTAQEFVDKAKTEIKVIAFLPKFSEPAVGKAAPIIVNKTLSGQPIDTEQMKGKVIVLNFWGTSCKPCIQEMPQLNNLQAQYSNGEVVFLAIAENSATQIQQFLQKATFTYEHLSISEGEKNIFGVTVLPVNMIIDKNGTVQYIKAGFSETIGADLEQVIKRLL